MLILCGLHRFRRAAATQSCAPYRIITSSGSDRVRQGPPGPIRSAAVGGCCAAARCGQAGASVRKLRRRRSYPSRRRFAAGGRGSCELTLIIARPWVNPSRDGTVRHAPEVQFSGRRPRCRGAIPASRRVLRGGSTRSDRVRQVRQVRLGPRRLAGVAPRHDAARPVRKFENCAVGGPIRRGGDSPPAHVAAVSRTLIIARPWVNPSRDGTVRHTPEVQFSGRRPSCRGAVPASRPRTPRPSGCGRLS